MRPDLELRDLRGNVDTRLARVGVDLDAVVLAAAGLDRIARGDAITERFPLDTTPTAPGQGALAVEVRTDDLEHGPYPEALRALDHRKARACALAERALLAALEAGCAAPVGASARISEGALHLHAAVYRSDGSERLEADDRTRWPDDVRGEDRALRSDDLDARSARLGRAVAAALLAGGAAALAPLGVRA